MEAVELLEQWLQWAWRSRIEAFVRLGDTIANHSDSILLTLEHRLSNALVEAVNTRIRQCSPSSRATSTATLTACLEDSE